MMKRLGIGLLVVSLVVLLVKLDRDYSQRSRKQSVAQGEGTGGDDEGLPGDGPGEGVQEEEAVAEVPTRSAGGQPAWRDDQVLVSAVEGASVAAIAADYGSEVIREGRGGSTALSVPDGTTPRELIATLQADPRLLYAGRQGITYGAGAPTGYQWHQTISGLDEAGEADVSDYVVAVLDTGVAYEDRGRYVAAPSLAEVRFVAPYDFVSSDDHPNDDHQHGTHITGLIASQGLLPGVAPGVAIMPLKVLDEHSAGTELDLIDAISWAVEHGADVINMSLTFGEGYAPSPGMQAALEAAHAAGVVMVAAAGNDARSEVGWPAASPLVIAVGSGCQAKAGEAGLVAAPYTNRGARVDILAPGGCMDRDIGRDGVVDGIVAETFGYQRPGELGYWLYAGTSQAAAVVSGAAVRLLEAGAAPEHVRLFLQEQADGESLRRGAFVDGLGPGQLDIEAAVAAARQSPRRFEGRRYHAVILPWLADRGGSVTPTAKLTVLEHDFEEAAGVHVYGRISGSTSQAFSCTTDEDGACTVSGPAVSRAHALGWQVAIDRIVRGNESYPPGTLMFASEGLEQLSESILSDETLEGAVMGTYWEDGEVEGLGPVAESLVVLSAGTGISTSPIGIIITPKLLGDLGEESPTSSTDPEGMRRIDLSGAGISTSPLGLIRVVAFSGAGISTSPFTAISTLSLRGAEDADWGDDAFSGEPVGLSSRKVGALGDDRFAGSAIEATLRSGGWVTAAGQDGAATLAGSGALPAHATSINSGAGLGAAPLHE